MKNKAIKSQKIESVLIPKIKDIYHQELEQKLDNISYKLFDRILVILIEGIITSPEKLLQKKQRGDLAKQVRTTVDGVIHPQIKKIIEEVLEVKVIDFLTDTTMNNNLTGAIAIFEFTPK